MMNCFWGKGQPFRDLAVLSLLGLFGIFAYGEDKDKGTDNDNDAHFKHDNLVVSHRFPALLIL